MSYLANAQKLRAEIDSAAALLTDDQAATVPGIYPVWNGDGAAYTAGDRYSMPKRCTSACRRTHRRARGHPRTRRPYGQRC